MKHVYVVSIMLSIIGLVGFYLVSGDIKYPSKIIINLALSCNIGWNVGALFNKYEN